MKPLTVSGDSTDQARQALYTWGLAAAPLVALTAIGGHSSISPAEALPYVGMFGAAAVLAANGQEAASWVRDGYAEGERVPVARVAAGFGRIWSGPRARRIYRALVGAALDVSHGHLHPATVAELSQAWRDARPTLPANQRRLD